MVLILISGKEEKVWEDGPAQQAWIKGSMTVSFPVGGFTGFHDNRPQTIRNGERILGYILEDEGCGRKWEIVERQ